MKIPKALKYNPTYENFEADCPYCDSLNIYNRASDLRDFKLITNETVVCQNSKCQKIFQIGGDYISPAWKMLILDCFKLKEQKQYAYCILNLSQAFEMYFALFFRVNLLYKPYGLEQEYNLGKLNQLLKLLFNKTKSWTYKPLRKTFINLIKQEINPKTLTESSNIIEGLERYSKKEPSDLEIENIKDKKLSNTLLLLKKCSIDSLRNDVVHKNGYRPTLEKVENAEEESTKILYSLDKCLNVLSDDLYLYETVL